MVDPQDLADLRAHFANVIFQAQMGLDKVEQLQLRMRLEGRTPTLRLFLSDRKKYRIGFLQRNLLETLAEKGPLKRNVVQATIYPKRKDKEPSPLRKLIFETNARLTKLGLPWRIRADGDNISLTQL